MPTWCAQRASTPTWPTATPRSSAASVTGPHRPHNGRRDRRSTRRRPARADPSRRNRLAAIPARSTRPTHNPSLRIRPATTTKPDLVPNEARPECASEQTRFDAEQRIGIPHAALDGLAQRHRTRPPRRAPQPTNRRPTASAPRPRHAPHVVALPTSHHVLTQRPRPTHFDAHRVVAFMQREHVRTQSRSGGQRQRIPVGPHAQSHARTGNEKRAGRGAVFEVCGIRSCR